MKSTCCHAPLAIEGDTTRYFVCKECGKPTDPRTASDTPRTDAAIERSDGQWSFELADCARQLERELAESQLEQIRERNRHESVIVMCGEQSCRVIEERDAWRACAEHLKDAVCTALNCGEQQGFEREFCKEALAHFEKLKGTQ